jgi:HAD superfamily hydrolase (TIGR01509 family)
MDGLLIDSERMAMRAWRSAAAEIGFHLDDATLLATAGRDDQATCDWIVANTAPDVDIEALAERRLALTTQAMINDGIPLKAGVTGLLDWLDATALQRLIATSSRRQRTAFKLERAGLADRFPVAITRDDVTHGKPHPEIYLKAAAMLGLQPADCLVLEDSSQGVRAASAAGMKVFMVPDGVEPPDDVRRLATGVFDSLHNVLEALCR